MTWSAPSARTKSIFEALQVPVTSAPRAFATWTANGPTLPDAPSISTWSPGRGVVPSRRRRPWIASTAECGTVAAVSSSMPSGIGSHARSGAATSSANASCPNA